MKIFNPIITEQTRTITWPHFLNAMGLRRPLTMLMELLLLDDNA